MRMNRLASCTSWQRGWDTERPPLWRAAGGSSAMPAPAPPLVATTEQLPTPASAGARVGEPTQFRPYGGWRPGLVVGMVGPPIRSVGL